MNEMCRFSSDFWPPSRRDPLRKGLILVAEDDPDLSKLLRIYLESQGIEVVLTKKGQAVVEICIQNIPDAIILDEGLPDINGAEVYRKLRSNPKTKHIPVAFMPKSSSIPKLKLGTKDKIITKPFDVEEIKGYIEGVMPKNPRAPGAILWQSDQE